MSDTTTQTIGSASPSPAASAGSGKYVALAGRLAIAAIFLLSAFGKLTAPNATIGYIDASGLPFPIVGYLGAIAIELGGTLALVVGFRTRAVALILAGFSLLTAIIFHSEFGDQNQFIHFWKNIAIAGGLLQVAVFGAGSIAFDRR